MFSQTPYEQAKTYLAKVLPWPEDPSSAFINVHWTYKNGHDKPGWTGRAVHSVSDAVKAIQYALKGADTRDIYVCMSSQREARERVGRNNHKYYTVIRNQENAVALKSLFLDVDFKGGPKGYPDEETAIRELSRFLTTVNLPMPNLIVNSGGGFHIYFTMMRALTLDEWKPLAFALAEATKRHGLKCDTQCTIDAARVLRIPDTFNRKTNELRPVRIVGKPVEYDYTVERIQQALEPYRVTTPSTLPAIPSLPPRGPLEGVSDLAAGIDQGKFAPIDLKSVVPECEFIRTALQTGGKDYDNTLWNLTTLLATFCDDGRAVAHLMGKKHPTYTPESTNEFFDRKEREKLSKGLGWPSCQTISASGCRACQSCVHFPKGKTPLHFGRPVAPAPVQLLATPQPAIQLGVIGNDLPKGYRRTPEGIVQREITDTEGATQYVPICSYPLTKPWLQRDPWYLHFTTETNKEQRISLPTEVIGTNEMRKHLQSQGLMLHDHTIKGLTEFFVSWIETLRATKDAVVNTVPFGWQVAGGKLEGFSYGGSVWTPNGPRVAPAADARTSSQYAPNGEITPWLEAARLITSQGRPGLDAIIASSFAAPLVRFTNKEGLLLSVYSQESGIGKTTAIKVALAVWADPHRAKQGLSDTQKSVINKMGELQSLPMYWDEIKSEEHMRSFHKLVFQVSEGKEGSRLTSSVKQREVGVWQTLLTVASNDSVLEFVTNKVKMTEAGLLRIFEYIVPPGLHGQIAESDASKIVGKLNNNYGQVGLTYAQFLGSQFERVERDVEEVHKLIEQEVQAKTDERYWTAMVACLLVGARYANELGFTEIDEAQLKEFLVTQYGNMRAERPKQMVNMKDSMNVSVVLGQFLGAARARHTLVTNRIWAQKGKPPSGIIKPLNDFTKLEAIWVHVGMDDKLVRISKAAMTDWLKDKDYSRTQFYKALDEQFGMKEVHGRIGGGTGLATVTEYLLEIDLNNKAHINFIDEV